MHLNIPLKNIFNQLSELVSQLDNHIYTKPCKNLSDATIGQHLRHIIELFQCLVKGYDDGTINYDKRKRDNHIETDNKLAAKILSEIYQQLDRPDKDLTLQCEDFCKEPDSISLSTNYFRELVYNMEHTIHHMAMIKIGVKEITTIVLPDEFGLAFSTIKYRDQCAQ